MSQQPMTPPVLPPLHTPREEYEPPLERGSFTVNDGPGGQSTDLWEMGRLMSQQMHLERDRLAQERDTAEAAIREFLGDDATQSRSDMTQAQQELHASYKGANVAIKGINKGKGKIGKALQQFKEDITAQDDPIEDDARDRLKHVLFKAKHPNYQSLVISGVSLHWHEVESVHHVGVQTPSFHICGMEGYMFLARPTGLQNTNHTWLKANTVEWPNAEWVVKGHDQRYVQFLLYTALFHEEYLRKTSYVAHDGMGGIMQNRLLKRNTLNRSCDFMQAATSSEASSERPVSDWPLE